MIPIFIVFYVKLFKFLKFGERVVKKVLKKSALHYFLLKGGKSVHMSL